MYARTELPATVLLYVSPDNYATHRGATGQVRKQAGRPHRSGVCDLLVCINFDRERFRVNRQTHARSNIADRSVTTGMADNVGTVNLSQGVYR